VDLAKREAMIAAAWTLFLSHGVQAVSMEAVAAAARVSKVTLYRHFPDTTALLEAGVLAEMERIEAAQQSRPAGGDDEIDVAERLRRFGLGIMGFLASDSAVQFYSTLAGELSRHPDLARRFWDTGPGRTRANLTRLLHEADTNGELVISDPQRAADHLFGLWQGFSNFQLALGIPEPASIESRVDDAVRAFLRAYPRPAPTA
jgi:TetR/AcrR family transcriptional repressor of mexJK operon